MTARQGMTSAPVLISPLAAAAAAE